MKAKAIKPFFDKVNEVYRKANEEFEATKARLEVLSSAGVAIEAKTEAVKKKG